ncbi:MAG: site-specific integrase [Bacteroidales bacterium]|nr:site-specific integrase [Bacteroidales bacterium]
MTFGEYWPIYKAQKKGFVKDTTIAAYTLIWDSQLSRHFNDVDMNAIKNSILQDYVNNKVGEGLSVSTVQDHISVVKNMIKHWRLSQDRPMLAFGIVWPTKSVNASQPREKYTDKELATLIEHCKNSDSHFCKVVALGAMAGLRIGELCGLQFGDFDFESSIVSVRRTVGRLYLGKDRTALFVNPPKCGASERRVPIPSWLNQYFKRYQRLYNTDNETYINRTLQSTGAVRMPFVEPRVFRSQYKALCAEVGIPYRTFHSLRHTYASRLLQAKVDIRTVAELLGHSDVQTTLNIYAHSDDGAKKSAAKKVFM